MFDCMYFVLCISIVDRFFFLGNDLKKKRFSSRLLCLCTHVTRYLDIYY